MTHGTSVKACSVAGCGRDSISRGFCTLHYQRHRRGDDMQRAAKAPKGSGYVSKQGYLQTCLNGEQKGAHVRVAEAALGRQLPMGAQVHHVNGNRLDNRPENLVICQDAAYHKLLHIRADALNASGNPAYRRCYFCREYDDVSNLRLKTKGGRINRYEHRVCANRYDRGLRARSKHAVS